MNPTLFLCLLVSLPLVGAVMLTVSRQPARARVIATGIAALTLVAAIAAPHLAGGTPADTILAAPWLNAAFHLGVDEPSARALPLVALLTLVTLIASPRQDSHRRVLTALLLTESATLGFFCAHDVLPRLLFFLSMAAPLATHVARGQHAPSIGRAVRVYLLLGTLPVLLTLAMLGWHGGTRTPFLSPEELASLLPHGWRPGLCALLLIGVCARLAVVPFHSWLPVVLTRGPLGFGVLWMNLAASLHLLTQVVRPLLPSEWDAVAPVLGSLGAGAALYGALLALVQTDLRRMLAFLLVSQSGLLLAGVSLGGPAGRSGAWLQCLSMGIAFTGLELLVRAIEARTGTTDLDARHGLIARAPRMATTFLLLGLGALGFPGTRGFLSEDLLLRGTLGAHPLLALPLLPALALNAITLLRAFQRAFLGPRPRGTPSTEDLLPRERWTTLALLVLLCVAEPPPAPHPGSPMLQLRADTAPPP
ncbi:proton-conducting transporter membrane subunit [Corallococcus terminator]